MKIYDTGTVDSIYHYTLGLLGIPQSDTTTLTRTDFIRSANVWYRDINEWIWKSQNYWQYDDTNRDTNPIGVTDLVDGQQEYTLPTNVFDIRRVEVLDKNGNAVLLKPLSEVPGAKPEFYKNAGLPIYYELVSNVISLYPKPDANKVTTTDGLKIYAQQDIIQFNTTSTWEPGIPRQFHDLIAFGVCKDKSFTFGMDNLYQKMSIEINNKRKELESHFSRRFRDLKRKIRPSINSYGL